MEIVISNSSGRPIYEQIVEQVKNQIIQVRFSPVDPLPSMLVLLQDLKMSVRTSKGAYGELEAEGFIETVAGKGCYVSTTDPEVLREGNLRIAEDHIQKAIDVARTSGISKEELHELIDILFDGDRL